MTRKNKMKEKYLQERAKWRAKYGRISIKQLLSEDQSDELLDDTGRLLIALGQWRAHHKRNLKARAYQTTYRIRNREKMRTYHRNYKRRVRATGKAIVWDMPTSG